MLFVKYTSQLKNYSYLKIWFKFTYKDHSLYLMVKNTGQDESVCQLYINNVFSVLDFKERDMAIELQVRQKKMF